METGGTRRDLYLKAKRELPQYFLHLKKKKKDMMLQLESGKGKYTNATAVKIDQTYKSW